VRSGPCFGMGWITLVALCAQVILAGCATAPRALPAAGESPTGQPAAPWLASFLHELCRPQPFLSHPASDADPGWLALPVSFPAVSRLRQGIETLEQRRLEHRGEAHITLVTPPEARAIREYDPALSIEVLEAVALPALETARWSTPGIGRVEGEGKRSWFLVVDSPDLRALRRTLARTFALPDSVFDAAAQDLHVTIGFEGGDLWPPAGSKGPGSLRPELGWDAVLGHTVP
jgi:hypothetical protein